MKNNRLRRVEQAVECADRAVALAGVGRLGGAVQLVGRGSRALAVRRVLVP